VGCVMMLLAAAASSALTAGLAVSEVERRLSLAYGDASYDERLAIGRRAQLGDEMIYRPGAIGCSVDTSLTYGEFDLSFYRALMESAMTTDRSPRPETIVDIGSGCGRLVLASAMLWPEAARVAGVEVVPALHSLAVAAEQSDALPGSGPARELYLGDAADVLRVGAPLQDASLCFCYSTTHPSVGNVLTDLSELCGACLRTGTRVVTTDKLLGEGESRAFKLVDALEGPNRETGGSVGYVWEVVRSARLG